jgi:secreted trypsin-like serine protease
VPRSRSRLVRYGRMPPMTGVVSKPGGRVLAAVATVVLAAGLAATMVSARPEPQKRVVGGVPADPADWPGIAALMYGGTQPSDHLCGATVIARRAALTAGHCVMDRPAQHLSVVIGRPNLSAATGVVIDVDKVLVHPRYSNFGHDDFAVLKLDSGAPHPYASLPNAKRAKTATAVGRRTRVAGWGSTAPDGSEPSDLLLETDQQVIRHQACARAFPWFERRSEICARGARIAGTKHRTSSCYGDSGGPLLADIAQGPRLVGVVSYGGRRCGVSKPTVYARVAHALGFIKDRAGLP